MLPNLRNYRKIKAALRLINKELKAANITVSGYAIKMNVGEFSTLRSMGLHHLYFNGEFAGFFFYYKKRRKGLWSFVRKVSVQAFEKYGIRVYIRRMDRMPNEFKRYYIGVTTHKKYVL